MIANVSKDKKAWFVYLVECADGTLYCGITTDIERRIFEHNKTKRGAKYTRSRRPVELIGYFKRDSRSKALREEIRIKQLNKKQKRSLFT